MAASDSRPADALDTETTFLESLSRRSWWSGPLLVRPTPIWPTFPIAHQFGEATDLLEQAPVPPGSALDGVLQALAPLAARVPSTPKPLQNAKYDRLILLRHG